MRLYRTLAWLAAVAASGSAQQATTITVSSQVLHTNVQRFGINLSGQTYYDSGQMLANLVARNPGFEGETWQTILHCKLATATTCTDENPYTVWPGNFIANAQYEVLSGSAAGATGTVLASSAANPPQGISLALTPPGRPLKAGDFILVRMEKPGSADAGWWIETTGGATLSTELHDLSPHTQGKQALRAEASGAQQTAKISSYFDTLAGHSFVKLRTTYRLRFRAKSLVPNGHLHVTLERLDTIHGRSSFLDQTLDLKPHWDDYTWDIPAHETGSSVGSVALTFTIRSASVLLDDVSLTPAAASPQNPTGFRDEVVQTLRELHPGVLRYMDNGTSFGSSLDNLLAPAFARERSGFSLQQTKADDVPIGLHDFLSLCAAVGADPWITLPPGLNQSEATHLVEYLAGTSKSVYGAKRAAMGRSLPWTQAFTRIHLELGNEQWNSGSFAGGTIADPSAYARRAAAIFTAMRTAASFQHEKFDLVIGSWAAVPWWTQQELAAAGNAADTVAVAPYLFFSFNDARNTEAVFGPMLAQPEQLDSRADGLMVQQAKAAADAHARLAVYETNLGTMSGTASQSDIDAAVPSIGAGLAVADHMLLMLRDLGLRRRTSLRCLSSATTLRIRMERKRLFLCGALLLIWAETRIAEGLRFWRCR